MNGLDLLVNPLSRCSTDCTVDNLVNEGPEHTTVFTCRRSGQTVRVRLDQDRGAKLWLSAASELLTAYIHNRLEVGSLVIDPPGSASMVRQVDEWISIRCSME